MAMTTTKTIDGGDDGGNNAYNNTAGNDGFDNDDGDKYG